MRTKNTDKSTWKDEELIELLNEGWRKVAEDTLCLHSFATADIEDGEGRYSIDGEYLRVDTVRLMDGSTLKAELTPEDPAALQHNEDSGEVTSSTPTHCSATLVRASVTEAVTELRLYPPPNWTATDGIEVWGQRAPRFISANEDVPDMPYSLGRAGLWWACFQITDDRKFFSPGTETGLYNDELRTYFRLGRDEKPLVMGKMDRGTTGRSDNDEA